MRELDERPTAGAAVAGEVEPTASLAEMLRAAGSDPRMRAILMRRLAARRARAAQAAAAPAVADEAAAPAAADEAAAAAAADEAAAAPAADEAAAAPSSPSAAAAGGAAPSGSKHALPDDGFPPGILAAMEHPDGMLAAPAKTEDGKVAPVGTVVHVTGASSGGELTVKVHSGFESIAVIPCASFRPEPGVVQKKDAAHKPIGPRDDVYQQYDNPLWGPYGPQPDDADTQGAIGDCYFMASLAAVCRSNPAAIQKLISPHTPSPTYSVHFYADAGDGSLKPTKSYAVDSWLPTIRGSDHSGAYGGGVALWVSILEKAWAMHRGSGSYDKIQGGWPSDAMEALTGVSSKLIKHRGVDGMGGGVIDQFRQAQNENRAVCISTQSDPDRKDIGWSEGRLHGDGDTLSALLDPSLVFESVQIYGPTFTAKDDANTNILQSGGSAKLKKGTVDYQKGTIELTFDSTAKPDPKKLSVAWSHCGPDFQRYGLVGTHAYRFVGVREPDAIKLVNPWGRQDPKPVDAPAIAKLFTQVATNAVPGAAARKMDGAAS